MEKNEEIKATAQILAAQLENLPAVMELIREAQAFLKAQGVDQWQNGYPSAEVILRDINRQEAWVMRLADGRIAAYMALSFAVEASYDKIYDGRWKDNRPYGVVHRLTVGTAFRCLGAGSRMLVFAEKICRERGRIALRIDTHAENRPMQALVVKNGFEKRGWIYLADGSLRDAFEKMLN